MARYRETEKGQGFFLTVKLSEQIIPGTFEHTLQRWYTDQWDLSRGRCLH